METFQNLLLGFQVALQWNILVYAFLGCIIGTLVGMMPGLGPLAGISLLLPATFGLNPIVAMVAVVFSLLSFYLLADVLRVPLPRGPWGW